MAVDPKGKHGPIESFEDWYVGYREDPRNNGCLKFDRVAECGIELWRQFEHFKREHAARVEKYEKYEIMADAEVVSKKPDLPNVSSGDIAGMIRRTARNIVQHTPNVEVLCEFAEDSPKGILAKHILRTKIIREELNSNEMQQNLFASTMSALTLGFDAVMPVLLQQPDGSWIMEYDTIHYRDVFPEPGVKDVRKAPEVFVRRYLTKGEIKHILRHNIAGWDPMALRSLLEHGVPVRHHESASRQDRKRGTIPDGYEIITWYSTYGDPFLTFDARTKMLLRIEKNRDPLKRHPVRMLVLEKDPQQPLGKSQVALVYGRQEFQDLMLNGAMKLWYRNINPTLLGYGTGLNGVPNMSPGKFTNIPNPNSRIEAFEVNTQTLLQYGSISQQNQGNMINLIGAADQQMAASAGSGMSATPQGVEAQTAMVDITTNNYQKAVEYFFSQYCSYALTVYFQELKNAGPMKPTADTRRALLAAGMPEDCFDDEGRLTIDLSEMATVYQVKCVPGSLVELEDEKQLRILKELYVPLSQAMPALAQTQDPQLLAHAGAAMQYIVEKTIKLSGSAHADELADILTGRGSPEERATMEDRISQFETSLGELTSVSEHSQDLMAQQMQQMQEQIHMLIQMNGELMQKLGITPESTASAGTDLSAAASEPVA